MASVYQPPAPDQLQFALSAGYIAPASTAVDFYFDTTATTARSLYITVACAFRSASIKESRVNTSWNVTALVSVPSASRWDEGSANDHSLFADSGSSIPVDGSAATQWRDGVSALHSLNSAWLYVVRHDLSARLPWAYSRALSESIAISQRPLHDVDQMDSLHWQNGQLPPRIYTPAPEGEQYFPPAANLIDFDLTSGYAAPSASVIGFQLDNGTIKPLPYVAIRSDPECIIEWGRAIQMSAVDVLSWGRGSPPIDPPPITSPWQGSSSEPPPIPVAQRVYIIMNSVTVVRMPDGTPIEVESVDMTASIDSWCWSFRMDLANPATLSLLKPDGNGPKVVQITMNGYAWTGIVEGWDYTRGFPGTGVSVTGRSQTALLSGDYTATRSISFEDALSAQQLALREINDRALPYTITWNGLDWLVPAGAWYYQDLAPIDVIAQIAAARGAVLQSDPGNAALIVQSRYPQSPWAWSADNADVALPVDWVKDMSSQQQTKPMYDAVIIAGQSQGVLAKVTRQGAAGETFAAQVVDQLIVSADVATERGRNVLGDRGVQELVSMTLPLMPAGSVTAGMSALYAPLLLVDVQDATDPFQGQSAAVTISARRAGDANKALEIWQQVSLERHRSDAN